MSDLSPRQWGKEPRVFHKTSEAPPVDLLLRDQDGDLVGCGEPGGWRYVEVSGRKTATSGADGCSWSDLDNEFDVAWPLTEVLPEKATVKECGHRRSCDCPPENVPPAQSPQDAPNSSSPVSVVGGGSETGGNDELRAELKELLSAAIATGAVHSMEAWERADEDLKNTWRLYGMRAADALLAAGWRPPQTDDEAEYGVRLADGKVLGPWNHADANGFMAGYHPFGALMQRRPAGPWEQVEQS